MTVCLLVTANVGSIFEDPNGLLKLWVKEFLQTIVTLEPKFVALHCQEVGGKNYEESMSYVDEFVRILLSSKELLEFEHIRVFLDEDFKTSDKFTALGNLYLVHKSQEAQIWDFNDQIFVPVMGKEIHSGNIENVPIKDKLKFPQEFFPECKWSRKGFMRTRWALGSIAFDLINIHIFHDESNFVAISDFPSPYAKNRRKALEYTLNLISKETFNDLPLFIFGDFNFRLNNKAMVQLLTNNAKPSQILAPNGALSRLIYRDAQSDRHLMVERKHFLYSDQNFFINRHNIALLLEHDKEPSHFEGLHELKIDFPPSYPFKEEITSSCYMNTRCPAWCDRVLMNKSASKLLLDDASCKPKYEMMGLDVPMGDHKPVYLLFKLPNREPREKPLLTCLLSHRTRVELEASQTEDDYLNDDALNPDCNQSQSSHFLSISPPCYAHTNRVLGTSEGFNFAVSDGSVLANSCKEDYSVKGAYQNGHFSCDGLVSKLSIAKLNTELDDTKTNNHSLNSFLSVPKSKSIQTDDAHLNNYYTSIESIEVAGQNGSAQRIAATSRIASLKQYCLCCIL